MAINTSIPWGGTTGQGGGYTARQWQQMQQRLIAPVDGILRGFDADLIVEESTPNALTVQVAPGSAIVQGIYVYNNDTVTVTIEANASGNPRIDGLALQVDWVTQTAEFVAVEGTPAASPVAPSMTQNNGTLWQMRLANVAVADSATTIAGSDITDLRTFADLLQNKDMNAPTVQATDATTIAVTAGVKSVVWPIYIRATTLDMATAGDWLDGSANESAGAHFYVYVNQSGDVKIHETAPTHADYWQSASGEMVFYHDGSQWWRLLGLVWNGASGDLDTGFPSTVDNHLRKRLEGANCNAGNIYVSSTADVATGIKVTFVSTGQPIRIQAAGWSRDYRSDGQSGSNGHYISIYRNGASVKALPRMTGSYYDGFAVVMEETPGPGEHVYELYHRAPSTDYCYLDLGSLTVEENSAYV